MKLNRMAWGVAVLGMAGMLRGGLGASVTVEAPGEEKSFVQFCRHATAEQVTARLKAGSDVNGADGSGCTPLMAAAMYNPRPEVVRVLVGAGAKVNDGVDCRDAWLLWMGVNYAHGDVVEKITGETEAWWTPLMGAAMHNEKAEVVAELVKLGADVKGRGACGCTALIVAAARNGNTQVIEVLAKAGAELDAQDQLGYTALMWAAGRNPKAEVVTALVKAGATVDFRDREGRTALMGATDNQEKGVIRVLVKAGADVNATDGRGMSVLGYARRYGEGTEKERVLAGLGAR